MHKENRGLTIATALLVLAGYTALYTVDSIGPTALLAPLIMLFVAPLGVWADRRFQDSYRRISTIVSVLVLLSLPFMSIAWGLLDTVTFLLVYIQAYELAHQKEIRNYYHIYLMAFFLLLSACAREPSAGIAVVIGLFLMSAVWAFFLLEIAGATRGSRRHSTPDIVPLHTYAALTLPPSNNSLRNGVILSATMMSIASVMLTVVLFMATPRMEAGVFGRNRDDDSRVQNVGLSQNVDFSGGRILVNRGAAVMRVQFPDEPGRIYDGPKYWRSHALNQYTPRAFQIGRLPVRGQLENTANTRLRIRTLRNGSITRVPWNPDNRIVHQQITLSSPGDQFPVLATPTRIESSTHRLQWSATSPGDVITQRSIRNAVQAKAWSEIVVHDPDTLRNAPGNYRSSVHLRNFQMLTRQDLQSRTRELVDQITANAENPYDACLAIQNYLGSNLFSYSLDLPPLPEENPIDAFLWDTRRGHCQLYASAMTLMVRSLDIPARIVNGYRGGTWDADQEAFTITSDMAHSWVEVYFLGVGWVRFDPAPPPDYSGEEANGILEIWNRFSLNSRIFWYQRVVGYQGGFQLSDFQNLSFANVFGGFLGGGDRTETQEASAAAPSAGTAVVWIALLTFGTLILIWTTRNRQRTTAHIPQLTADQRRAQRLFLQLREIMKKRGIEVTNTSAADLLAHRELLDPDHQAECDAVVHAYNLARFGERPLEPGRFREWLAKVKSFRR